MRKARPGKEKLALQKDLREMIGEYAHDKLLLNTQLAVIPRNMSSYNNSERDIEFVVSRSPSRIHVINTCETIDENIERILQEQRYSDEDVRKLTPQFTFRLYTDGMVFDARDVFEVIELSRCLPD